MKFTDEIAEEIKAAAGKTGLARVTPDRRILHAAPVTNEGAALILKIATRERIVVRTRLFPYGAEESAQFHYRVIQLDLSRLAGVIEYSPEDFTIHVRAGTPLRAIQEAAAAASQWLPVDPPADNALSIGEVIAKNEAGPRRTGYGPIRDHLLGAVIATPNGNILKTGGAVVKSATGYDLHRLQAGALESLAVGLEYILRLRAKPEAAATIAVECQDRGTAIEKALRVRDLIDHPAALFIISDLVGPTRVVVRYEGSQAAVDVATERARPVLGPNRVEPAEGDKLLMAARDGGLEPGFRTPGRSPITLRIGSRPSRIQLALHAVTLVMEKVHKPVAACIHPSIGVADLWIPKPENADPRQILNEARAELMKLGGGFARLRRPFETHGGEPQPSWPDSAAYAVMARLKQSSDPLQILNPGVLPFPAPADAFAPDVPPPEQAPAARPSGASAQPAGH
ncbi:MAG: FAD-binding oxidoreductase [Planctomycetes bacterium]|nr:FAD-binding oxidoreductase [Planctomycetota bacterium]